MNFALKVRVKVVVWSPVFSMAFLCDGEMCRIPFSTLGNLQGCGFCLLLLNRNIRMTTLCQTIIFLLLLDSVLASSIWGFLLPPPVSTSDKTGTFLRHHLFSSQKNLEARRFLRRNHSCLWLIFIVFYHPFSCSTICFQRWRRNTRAFNLYAHHCVIQQQ